MEENLFTSEIKVNITPTRSAVDEFLDVARILTEEGIDVSKIRQKVGGRTNPRFTILADLDTYGKVNMKELCLKHPELRLDYPIGRKINDMKHILKGNSKGIKVKPEQYIELESYFSGKKDSLEELLEVLSIISPSLKEKGMSIGDIQLRYQDIGVTLGELYFDDIICYEIKEELRDKGYDSNFPIGQRIIGAKRLLEGKKTNYSTKSLKTLDELRKYIPPSRTYTRLGDINDGI